MIIKARTSNGVRAFSILNQKGECKMQYFLIGFFGAFAVLAIADKVIGGEKK